MNHIKNGNVLTQYFYIHLKNNLFKVWNTSSTATLKTENYYYVYIEMMSQNFFEDEENLMNKLEDIESVWPPVQNQTYPDYGLGWTRINESNINNSFNMSLTSYTYTDEKDAVLIIFPNNLKLYSTANIDMGADGVLSNHNNYDYYIAFGNPNNYNNKINLIIR